MSELTPTEQDRIRKAVEDARPSIEAGWDAVRFQLIASRLYELSKQVQRDLAAAQKEIEECIAKLKQPLQSVPPIDFDARKREYARQRKTFWNPNGGGDAS